MLYLAPARADAAKKINHLAGRRTIRAPTLRVKTVQELCQIDVAFNCLILIQHFFQADPRTPYYSALYSAMHSDSAKRNATGIVFAPGR